MAGGGGGVEAAIFALECLGRVVTNRSRRYDNDVERAVRLTAVIMHEGDWYVARAVEVEVASQGASVEESLLNLREALELYFEDEPVPPLAVEGPIIAPVDVRLSA
ncbi:MAG: type II toxin-antitoxin system HicB family antitoxin [Frankia sp.]